MGGGGSSNLTQPMLFKGILSKSRSVNPDFYNWNKVILRYCDGGAFTGDVERVDPATNLHFRGARIFDAFLEELLAKGFEHAKNAVFAGNSAGAYPAMLYCDRVRDQLPNNSRVKCVVDSGYFIHVKNPEQAKGFESIYKGLVDIHGSAKALPKSCTSRMKPELCFFPENMQHNIKTPLFIMMSAFDNFQVEKTIRDKIGEFIRARNLTAAENKLFRDFRLEFLNALPKGDNPKLRGAFIDSFNHHSELQTWWHPSNVTFINNLTASEVFSDWYFDRNYSYVIEEHDLPYPVYFKNDTFVCRG